ncbi:alpha/beta hydrolase [Mycolicibacterium madagascariense]|uniref:Alpha/beta hydrolase n=1 Tax=Mycolicibacterium madagascariense TaxID=212765 RepID=A0A7I7XLA7_9MYCO|nr:alpha/beta hydrolase [Mycolicibacterium madagascariense]MCV7012311.1 alpha/beta hydrolase [Mycolicibacterium madagascariense]BBZ29986.1 alpha/beta hydrolase [Mycolicibacterium madagascariense]
MRTHNIRAHGPAPLVLVHGNPENAAVWGPLLEVLDRTDAIALSPPGFGVPLPRSFPATVDGYHRWLVERLESFGEPVDLVGHDWGGVHVVGIAMARPDLIRSWVSDALGVYADDYVWHAMARVWQQEGAGEESIGQLFGRPLSEQLEVVAQLGMSGDTAVRVAAGMDATMGRAVLSLLRSAAQPVMADAGRALPRAAERPGLALIAMQDLENASGTTEQHRRAATLAGARIAPLDDSGHWWPVEGPAEAARAMRDFWASLG